MLLLGTTDALHEGAPEAAVVTPADVDQVLREARLAVADVGPVRATFCGLRVLPGGYRATARARRETVFSRGPSGMLTVAGGKLTTYRRIALEALEHLRSDLALHRLDRRPRPLPGAAGLQRVSLPDELPPLVRGHLLHLYGSLAPEVLAPAANDPSLLEPLRPDGPDLAAQALYGRTHEWAVFADDVLRRRTTVWLRGERREARERVSELIGSSPAARAPSRRA
jgi:glycerol-3-phosphate dehydrogenase